MRSSEAPERGTARMQDRKGDFPVQKVMSNFFNLNATRVDLFLSMKTEFPNYPLEILIEIKSELKRIP